MKQYGLTEKVLTKNEIVVPNGMQGALYAVVEQKDDKLVFVKDDIPKDVKHIKQWRFTALNEDEEMILDADT